MRRLSFFVTSTGTDAGKTYLCRQLIKAARAADWSVTPTKPVMSGFTAERLSESDAALLAEAAGLPDIEISRISPWRFAAEPAPPHAAEAEGVRLSYREIRDYCLDRMQIESDLHLVEGAGGIMSPLTHDRLNIHLAVELDLPVVLVVPAYLGAVSHALTAIEVVRGRGLDLAWIVVNDRGANQEIIRFVEHDLASFAPGLRQVRIPHRCRSLESAAKILGDAG